ncbi:hypothetical protein Tco_0839239 [Tanacetum coccineum]|uniref:Uncharacterized protein n=1 Tax=Tanacetum coccineum TaxID=301880 RepID=A0ABQ5ASV6_9ASTR
MRRDAPRTPSRSPPPPPPPPPPPAGASDAPGTSGASESSQLPPPPLPPPSTNPSDQPVTPEPAWSIPSSNLPVPTNNWASALASTYVPPPENSLLAQTSDMATFMDWYYKKQGITALTQKDLEGPTFEIVKVFHPNVIHIQYQMEECHKLLTDQVDDVIIRYNVSKPLPLGGLPGQVTIQADFFFNKDLEYLRYGSKGSRPVLSISKMKAAYYPDVGLEQMVSDQMWIEEECQYDIAAMYVFSLYGYDYMKKIVLHRADLKEHIIPERDYKYLYPSDFEDLYLLNLQGHLDHLPPKDKQILTTAYKHDFTIIDSPRAVTFRDKYGVQMIMRFNEIHKFSDGTLHQIDEALDYRVKEFKVNMMNPGLDTRFWTRKDVDRSKEFIFSIQKWLKTRRIFRNLESFVGRRVGEGRNRVNTYAVRSTWLIADIEDKYHGPSNTLYNPPKPLKVSQKTLVSFSRSFTHCYRPSHSELVGIEKVAVCSSIRLLKSKRTIKFRAMRSSTNLARTLNHNTHVPYTL